MNVCALIFFVDVAVTCGYHKGIYLFMSFTLSLSLFVHTGQVPKHFTSGYTRIILYVTNKLETFFYTCHYLTL